MGLLGCAGKADPAEVILGQYAAYGEITCNGNDRDVFPVGLVDEGYLTGEQCEALDLALNPRRVIVYGGNKGLLILDDSEKKALEGLGVQRAVLEKIAGSDGKEALNRHVRRFSSEVTDWCLTDDCKYSRSDAIEGVGNYAPHASEGVKAEAVTALINFVNEKREAVDTDGVAYRRSNALQSLIAIGTEPARSVVIKEVLRKDKGRFYPGQDVLDRMTLTPDTIELAFDTAHAGKDDGHYVAEAKEMAAQLIFKSFIKLSDKQKERALRLFDANMKDGPLPLQYAPIKSLGAHIAEDGRIFDRFMSLVEDKKERNIGIAAFDGVLNCVLTEKRKDLYPMAYQYIEEFGAERYTRQLGELATDEAIVILKKLLWTNNFRIRADTLSALSKIAEGGQREKLLDLVPHLENFRRYGGADVQVSANLLLSKLTTPWWNEFMPWDKVMQAVYH